MAIILKKFYIIGGIFLFTTLYLVENFKNYNKHLYFLVKKISFVIKNILVIILIS